MYPPIKQLTPEEVREYLTAAGVKDIDGHMNGWDLSKSVYLRTYEPGERLQQHVANPFWDGGKDQLIDSKVGSYFSLPGVGMDETGTGSGVSGRRVHEFEVVRPFEALEGTAAPIDPQMAKEKGFRLGGEEGSAGGATQVFIREEHLIHLGPAHKVNTLAGEISGDPWVPGHEPPSQQSSREIVQDGHQHER